MFRRFVEQAIVSGPVTEADVAHDCSWPADHKITEQE